MSQFIAAMRGHLGMISPSEVCDSFLRFLAGKVQDPAASNDSLLTCRRLMLLVELKLILVKNHFELEMRAIQCREKTGIAFNGLCLTAVQRMFQIYSFARTKAKSILAQQLHFLREKSGIAVSTGERATVHVSGPWLPPVLELSCMESRS